MMESAPPVTAIALFFDDVRVELSGKAIFIGQYLGDLLISPGHAPPDRLVIVITAKWPRDYTPQKCSIKIQSTGQPPIVNDFPVPPKPDFSEKVLTPFSGVNAQGIIQMRVAPFRPGDTVDVWFVVDGYDLPAGQLQIANLPPDYAEKLQAAVTLMMPTSASTASPPPSEQSPGAVPESKKRRERLRL